MRELKNGHNSVTVQNRTHVYMNFFDHKDLGNHLLQLCPKVVKHPVYIIIQRKIRVLIYLQILPATFPILGIIQGDTVINVLRSSRKVPVIPVRF